MHADFPIDPELRVRASPERILRRTSEAFKFIRQMAFSRPGSAWSDLMASFQEIRDEWSAIEGVVHLEVLLEAEGLLIEEKRTTASPRFDSVRSRAV
jgi:hypothetical protein